ncbi:hypothetical protein BH11PSE8_BH11PSE8_28950 [soil metagenome]
MFFANMFCYGSDLNAVGITGILGCMGVVYRGATRLYAVHIPPMSAHNNALGGSTFAEYVSGLEGDDASPGDLFFFLNGTSRASAIAEAHDIKSLMKPKTATLFRIMTGLGKGSGSNTAEHSPSILVTHRGFMDLRYKVVPEDQYVEGGVAEAGQYLGTPGEMGSSKVPSDYLAPAGWTIITGENSYRVGIR